MARSVSSSIPYLARVSRSWWVFPLSRLTHTHIKGLCPSLYWRRCFNSVSQNAQDDSSDTINSKVESSKSNGSFQILSEEAYKRKFKQISWLLANGRTVKGKKIILLMFNTKVTQLQQMKELLKMYKENRGFNGGVVSSNMVSMCLRLKVPQEALEIFSNPTEYNLYPALSSASRLMKLFAVQGEVESLEKMYEIKGEICKRQVFSIGDLRTKARTAVLIKKLNKEDGLNQIKVEEISDSTPQCALSEDEAKVELDQILHLCNEVYVCDNTSSTYYFVFGRLLKNGHFSLAKHMINKLHEVKDLPQRMLLFLQMDYHCYKSEYSQVIELVRKVKEDNVKMLPTRLSALKVFFEGCPSPDLKKTFLELNVGNGDEELIKN